MFPWMMHSVATLLGDYHFVWVGAIGALLQSYINTILLYRVGTLIYKDAKMAELSAYLYIASHSVLYQMTFYSENTFLMFTLLGFYAMYGTAQAKSTDTYRDFAIPRSSSVLLGCLFFGLSTLTRSTGVLLSIFIAFFMGNKFLVNCDRLGPSVKAVFTSLVCIVIMFTPLLIVIYWKPTVLHCDLRQDRDWQGPFPSWC